MDLKSTFVISILRYLLLMLSIARSCFMDGDFGESNSIPSSSPTSWSLVGAEAIEIVGPRDFQALSGDLVVWTRLSPLVFNLSGTLDLQASSLSMQLLLQSQQKETLLTTQSIPSPITTSWEKVSFGCNLVVQGGLYNVRLVVGESSSVGDTRSLNGVGGSTGESESPEDDYLQPRSRNFQILSNITIRIRYPTILFEVPHRIEAYTTSTPITFGLTRSTACEPKLPLPSTLLVLSICTRTGNEMKTDPNPDGESDTNLLEVKECNRDFATIFQDPLHSLQKEGRITMSVECHLWARNATYRVQLKEKSSKIVIAKSRPIRVDWGSQFSLNMSKPTVMPCRGSIRAIVSYPSCILPGKDKIRIYGHETLSVPSLLVPSRPSYIGEQQIRPNNRVVTFRCNLFPQRFLRFCFRYINTAVDDSVAVVMEKCIPTNPPFKLADGGWGAWSVWTPCTVTCGSDGRQFRYRFCDNPPPSSGANFCQGDAIEERVCDNTILECPQHPSVLYIDSSSSSSESLSPPLEESESVPDFHHHHKHTFHQLELENITITPGCECGCILYDLVPGKNETLVIFISSNHSSPCADEDEVDHHKFKWIFHTKDERDRVLLEVVTMEVHCVTITFRDGNTTDSNLLQVITSEEQQTHYDLLLDHSSQWEGDEEEVYEPMTLESTGSSMSIATAADANKNCTGQFIYFIAYYSTLTSTNSSQTLTDSAGTPVISWISYEFWTFLVLKLILLFFVVIVILSGFGGCVTKAYKKGKYKELKCFENEDEGTCSETNPLGEDDTSRCTSVTLMSFDYSYWRRLRILRLKYFLLRPKPLNYLSARVKSFPTTPTHHRVITKKNPVRCKEEAKATGSAGQGSSSMAKECGDKSKYRLSKSISLSETNLRGSGSGEKYEKVGTRGPEQKSERRADEWPLQRKEENEGGADGARSEMGRATYCGDPLGLGSSIGSTSVSNSLNGSDATSFSMSTSTNRSGSGGESRESWCKQNEKLLKEKENLKRRGWKATSKEKAGGNGKQDLNEEERWKLSKRKISRNLTNKKEKRVEGELTGLERKRDLGKSELSVATAQSLRLSSSCGEDESRVGSRAELEDADQDFEMDYYDYDVMNVGTIPGSYLGLEPAFVLWNSEVYQQEQEQEEEPTERDNLIIPTGSGSKSSNASNNTSSHESFGECDIEMTTTATASSSQGIFSDPHFTKGQITVRETSLDTLKFADEEESDIDDNATQASDSIFDNEHDLINASNQSLAHSS